MIEDGQIHTSIKMGKGPVLPECLGIFSTTIQIYFQSFSIVFYAPWDLPYTEAHSNIKIRYKNQYFAIGIEYKIIINGCILESPYSESKLFTV